MKKEKVLVIDDEKGIRETLSLILGMENFEVEAVENAAGGLSRLDAGEAYDFIICDIRLPGMGGIEFLKEARARDVEAVIIMISAYGTMENSIEAIKAGAADYINKPINSEELILRMRMAGERQKLKSRNDYLERELGMAGDAGGIIYTSAGMAGVMELSLKASRFRTTVLITGESGTGKELVAKAIHAAGPRKAAPFVAVNCASIPETLIESELFGYARGAFTGAENARRGLIEEADGGTLFLDEIGELPMPLQPKLLRALQEGEIRRLGDTRIVKVDVRVIGATSRDLERDVADGKFRNDLYYRLNVFPVRIPPLRERKEDIPALVAHFISKYGRHVNRRVREAAPEVISELSSYDWPGNVRELENVVERAIILSDSEFITRIDKVADGSGPGAAIKDWIGRLSFNEARQEIERAYIERALAETGGNRTRAAKILGISRRSLLYKLKEREES
ncbi:MAG: sigma-54-dependent Fis family transcriptional regulator [Candidatus Dadabacteria bacterium]|nr:sigma-54-dependent Fis family transcriptional regulator [Candidatus Dadabacteria bacterium]